MRIERPPLPLLALKDGIWEGRDALPEWASLQDRSGPYASRGPGDAAVGIDVMVDAPGGQTGAKEPAPEQIEAYVRLKAGGAAMAATVLEAVFGYVRSLDPAYGLPGDLDRAAVRGMVGLSIVHILDVAKGGLAYVGFELGCDWDDEHGCGVMTHGGRVVEIGGADTSFLGWIAEKDGGNILE